MIMSQFAPKGAVELCAVQLEGNYEFCWMASVRQSDQLFIIRLENCLDVYLPSGVAVQRSVRNFVLCSLSIVRVFACGLVSGSS